MGFLAGEATQGELQGELFHNLDFLRINFLTSKFLHQKLNNQKVMSTQINNINNYLIFIIIFTEYQLRHLHLSQQIHSRIIAHSHRPSEPQAGKQVRQAVD